MEMQMKDALPRIRTHVRQDAIAGLHESFVFSHLHTHPHEVPEQTLIGRADAPHGRNVPPWNDEDVDGGLRVEILKRHRLVILIDRLGGYAPVDPLRDR